MAWIAAVAGYLSTQSAKKERERATASQDRLYGVQADTASKLQPYIGQFYDMAGGALKPGMDYWSSIMRGGRSNLTEMFAPEISETRDRFRMARDNSAMLMPRGGARASRMAEMGFDERDAIQSLFNNARSAAPGELARIASIAGTLGAGAGGISINAGNAASAMGMNTAALRNMYNKQIQEGYGQIGESLWDIWKNRDKGEG